MINRRVTFSGPILKSVSTPSDWLKYQVTVALKRQFKASAELKKISDEIEAKGIEITNEKAGADTYYRKLLAEEKHSTLTEQTEAELGQLKISLEVAKFRAYIEIIEQGFHAAEKNHALQKALAGILNDINVQQNKDFIPGDQQERIRKLITIYMEPFVLKQFDSPSSWLYSTTKDKLEVGHEIIKNMDKAREQIELSSIKLSVKAKEQQLFSEYVFILMQEQLKTKDEKIRNNLTQILQKTFRQYSKFLPPPNKFLLYLVNENENLRELAAIFANEEKEILEAEKNQDKAQHQIFNAYISMLTHAFEESNDPDLAKILRFFYKDFNHLLPPFNKGILLQVDKIVDQFEYTKEVAILYQKMEDEYDAAEQDYDSQIKLFQTFVNLLESTVSKMNHIYAKPALKKLLIEIYTLYGDRISPKQEAKEEIKHVYQEPTVWLMTRTDVIFNEYKFELPKQVFQKIMEEELKTIQRIREPEKHSIQKEEKHEVLNLKAQEDAIYNNFNKIVLFRFITFLEEQYQKNFMSFSNSFGLGKLFGIKSTESDYIDYLNKNLGKNHLERMIAVTLSDAYKYYNDYLPIGHKKLTLTDQKGQNLICPHSYHFEAPTALQKQASAPTRKLSR